jgi:hypothetical protein
VCPAFNANHKRLNDPSHLRFQCTSRDFLRAFHSCDKPKPRPYDAPISSGRLSARSSPPNT